MDGVCFGVVDAIARKTITVDHYFSHYSPNLPSSPLPLPPQPIMSLHISTLNRNKRCLLAYVNHRISKVRDLRWETSIIPIHLKDNLGKEEIQVRRGDD